MPPSLCITVRFAQPAFHGRGDRGEPEWPPSPLRVFQALVAAPAARWGERERLEAAAPALRWIERQPPPAIVAAVGKPASTKYRLYVPDNVGDVVARSWSRGGSASLADYRTEKDVGAVRLGGRFEAVHYLWPASGPDFEGVEGVLIEAARSITHVGWGVDMVVADAAVLSDAEVAGLAGERWRPAVGPSGTALRVPAAGTLEALVARHEAFLGRLGPDGFRPVAPLGAFRVVDYRRATEPPPRPFEAFGLLKADATHERDFRVFDTPRRAMAVAGMLRHAAGDEAIASALGWGPERVARFALGHGEPVGQPHAPVEGPRLAYLPVPSIEPRGRTRVVTGIRRVLITVLNGDDGGDLGRLARLLSGSDLVAEGQGAVAARLSRFHRPDPTVRLYTRPATSWATVTPVILPGYDDPRKIRKRLFPRSESDAGTAGIGPNEQEAGLARLDRRIDHLLRKAIRQAGHPEELARCAAIAWNGVGFWPGTEPATRYAFPNRLRRFRRLHVRIGWRDADGEPIEVPGPISLGGGRYCGLGLFAAMD